jgi:negative regulator of flagellin synthesis FlgM
MKIGQITNTAAPAAVGNNERKAGETHRKGPAPAASSADASTQVDLSATANALSEGDATFDAAKVERIAQAIKDGKFTVNPDAIADKLISNAQELLGRSGNSH